MSWLRRTLFGSNHQQEQRKFEALYRALSERLFRRLLAQGTTGASAEEAVQEAFLIYWERFHAPLLRNESVAESVEDPFYWLLRVARNKAIDAHRRLSTAAEKSEAISAVLLDASPSQEESHLQEEALRKTMLSLKPREAELLIYREVEGMSYDELAHTLQLERASVGTLLRRARKAFEQAYLAQTHQDEESHHPTQGREESADE